MVIDTDQLDIDLGNCIDDMPVVVVFGETTATGAMNNDALENEMFEEGLRAEARGGVIIKISDFDTAPTSDDVITVDGEKRCVLDKLDDPAKQMRILLIGEENAVE